MAYNNPTIVCPTCHLKHKWIDSKPWSPFCSKRCKLIDLGDWASEKHIIAGKPEFDSVNKEGSVNEEDSTNS